MTQECRPAPGAEDGSWHVLWKDCQPWKAKWFTRAEALWNIDATNCGRWTEILPGSAAKNGYTYGQPLTPPPREMTREEMMEIAREAVRKAAMLRESSAAIYEMHETLVSLSRGTKP